jgi:hypothetical protein
MTHAKMERRQAKLTSHKAADRIVTVSKIDGVESSRPDTVSVAQWNVKTLSQDELWRMWSWGEDEKIDAPSFAASGHSHFYLDVQRQGHFSGNEDCEGAAKETINPSVSSHELRGGALI